MNGTVRNDSGKRVRIPGDPVNFRMLAGVIVGVLCTRMVVPPAFPKVKTWIWKLLPKAGSSSGESLH